MTEAEKVNIENINPAELNTIADKLRYYRNRKGLLQREVADYIGIESATYSAYEEDGRDYYPVDILKRIAALYDIDLANLQDDYNAFLCAGQAEQVQQL